MVATLLTISTASLVAAKAPGSFVSLQTDFDAASRLVTVKVTNTANQGIIGGAITVTLKYSDSSEKASTLKFDLLPSVGLEGKMVSPDPNILIGALRPGQTYRIQQPAPTSATGQILVGARADIRAVIFLDNTAAGDSEIINELFERWRDLAIAYSAWHKKSLEAASAAGLRGVEHLSSDAKALLGRYPGTRPRNRSIAPVTEDEKLARDPQALDDVSGFAEGVRSGPAQFMSDEQQLDAIRDYLRLRADTAAAHSQRKETE